MGFSIQHLLLTLVIVVLVFGTKRFKSAGADLGEAIKGFRKAIKDGTEDQQDALKGESILESKSAVVEKELS